MDFNKEEQQENITCSVIDCACDKFMHVLDEAKGESLLTTDEGTLSSTPGSMGIGGAREEQQLWSEIPQSGSTCREGR